MIIFFADGRLGNQIFQYLFLKTIQKKNEKVIVFGFENLIEVFEINDIINLNKKNKLLQAFLFRICKPILHVLSTINTISSYHINREIVYKQYTQDTSSYTYKKGLFSHFTFVHYGVFHSEDFFDKSIVKSLVIRKQYTDRAIKVLKTIPENSTKIFVHIRLGDYKKYTVYGKNPLLPLNYYKMQINWFLQNKTNCYFIFLSDEPKFIEKEFEYLKEKIISYDNDAGTDFAIMTKCNNAILSASSFGWWGAYLIEDKDTIFAPKFWLGFNSKTEYPSNAIPNFMKQVEII